MHGLCCNIVITVVFTQNKAYPRDFGNIPFRAYPDSRVHGASMGPTWGRQDPGGLHVGPMNFAIWVLRLNDLIYNFDLGFTVHRDSFTAKSLFLYHISYALLSWIWWLGDSRRSLARCLYFLRIHRNWFVPEACGQYSTDEECCTWFLSHCYGIYSIKMINTYAVCVLLVVMIVDL